MTLSESPSASIKNQLLPHIDGLNDRQREAVQCLDGPVLVLAGAGTGKTRALTSRIIHLIYMRRANPWEILAVTFTNKAAREMRERVGLFLGDATEQLRWLGTFHSICARILRQHAEFAGLNPNFTILDKQDQLTLLKQLIDAEKIDIARYTPRAIAALIDRWKNRGWNCACVPKDEVDAFDGIGIRLYSGYQERLKTLNAVDFGDLILKVVDIFKGNPDVLSSYQRRFKYINVDEYQDTNTVQYLWLRLLTQEHDNICCVGDDDQSIYGWRGADVQNILRFQDHFRNARVFKLEQNYRSTGHILGAANGLIAHNANRLGKSLWTNVPPGGPVRVHGHFSGEEEAIWIGDEIESLIQYGVEDRKYEPNEIAILVRASFLTRVLEDRFLLIGMPYKVVGGLRFYERKEIKDAIAFFRLAISRADSLAFERVANVPKRGVGPKAMQTIQKTAFEFGISLPDAVERLLRVGKLKNPAAAGLQAFMNRLANWSQLIGNPDKSAADVAMQILDESGMTAALKKEKTIEAESRLENLKELVTVLREFENLQGFVEHISLMSDNEGDDDEAKISIMTMHAAKGLEFPVVFLPGWEEEIFPSKRALDEAGSRAIFSLEEERRLAYVGITRAMEICAISHASQRVVFGRSTIREESRFVRELPAPHVESLTPPALYGPLSSYMDADGALFEDGPSYRAPGYARMVENLAQIRDKKAGRGAGASVGLISDYKPGDRVYHSKFGSGKIIGVNGDKCSVHFDDDQFKNILTSYLSSGEKRGS
ncbi:MAG: UvrD-helicase domain-containing protein [Albidovulum sp.]|nr:UvrD-helicase domain-containing protein [Albidovulum sp.]